MHDHTVWGLVRVLRGAEIAQSYAADRAGRLQPGVAERLAAGAVCAVSPRVGDIHRVANALADRPSISIHVYGANIGAVARHVFVPESGKKRAFVSGHDNAMLPNLWDRSAEARFGRGVPYLPRAYHCERSEAI